MDPQDYRKLQIEMSIRKISVIHMTGKVNHSPRGYLFCPMSGGFYGLDKQELIDVLGDEDYDSLATYVEMGACFGS